MCCILNTMAVLNFLNSSECCLFFSVCWVLCCVTVYVWVVLYLFYALSCMYSMYKKRSVMKLPCLFLLRNFTALILIYKSLTYYELSFVCITCPNPFFVCGYLSYHGITCWRVFLSHFIVLDSTHRRLLNRMLECFWGL